MGHEMRMLGLDAGGTSTRAVLADARGQCLGYGVGGRGNPISAGRDGAADGVMQAIGAALGAAGCALSEVSVITAAMAGHSVSGGDEEWLLERLRAEGFTGRLTFEADLLATYYSGAAEDFGYAIVSGTGACVIRVGGGVIEKAGDGLGWLLGDRGSGFWIGRRVARAVVQDLDGTGPFTAMTGGLLDHLGLGSESAGGAGRPRALEQIVRALYARPPVELASLAPLAFIDGDPVAARIQRRAGEHLADTLLSVLTLPGPLVIGGGVLSREGLVRDSFLRRLGDDAQGLELRSVPDGAVGAGLLALRAGGVPPSEVLLAALADGVRRLR
ncbi:ATPase BadF/BadG/BcrA/BcrD type [Microbacterium sp. HM58-2]|nr:ATPase BadF/BadG/BcrA/BcrD type [Microbacterium sp. HM58-2]